MLKALDEYDSLGATRFKALGGYTRDQQTHIVTDGRDRPRYPAKPIYGRAANYNNDELKGAIRQIDNVLHA